MIFLFQRWIVIVYTYSKCSTCQKAVRFLEENGIKFQIKDIVNTRPSIEELEKMLHYKQNNLRKLFNTSGQLYRDMQLSSKLDTMPLKAAFILLAQNGMLIKRPFLLGNGFGLVGFIEKEWMQVFAK